MMNKADQYATQKHVQKKPLIAVAREAVQTAEDSRAIAVTKMEEERQANERQASADAQAQSQAQAAEATRQKEQVEAEAAQAAAQAKSDMADSQAASAAARAAAQADAENARMAALQADREKQELRSKLAEQLNLILETRDSARGLIVNMSDVLFDSGKFTLRPGAREKLAKLSGILLAHPGLQLAVEGYTDNVGTDAYNMNLSENRADSVRDYLIQQGIVASSVRARGFGESRPVASNDSAAGRQENRRVELVVSGEAIGTAIRTTGSLQ